MIETREVQQPDLETIVDAKSLAGARIRGSVGTLGGTVVSPTTIAEATAVKESGAVRQRPATPDELYSAEVVLFYAKQLNQIPEHKERLENGGSIAICANATVLSNITYKELEI
jgi:hypothetical protein